MACVVAVHAQTITSPVENETKPIVRNHSAGGAVLAKYAYLSDGMKSGAFHADGSGFIYRGSLKYARHYSPALRRWLTPDPLSEKYYTSSSYAYCAGDPVNLVDPDGTSIGLPIKMAKAAKKVVKSGKKITSGALLAATVYGYYDDIVTLTSPEATPGEIGLAAFDLMTGFGSEAKLAATHLGIHGLAATNLRSFTVRNFRHNLGSITGGIREGMQAHHVLPKKHENKFMAIGINVHDPKYGAWLEPFIHNSTHAAYDERWVQFFKGFEDNGITPTIKDIEDFARQIMLDFYGEVPLNF